MAFASKLGNVLKNAINTTPSLYQSIRCMSSSKLFIGGISYGTDDQSLREAFTKYGEVVEARVILDRESGRSRGFGFVTFTSSEEASAAITDMDGQNLHGRIVKVNYANDRSSGGFRSGYGGGGGFGGAGYGGGGNYGGSYGDGSAGGNYGNYSGGGGGNYGGGNYGGGSSGNYGGNYRGGDVGGYGGGGGGGGGDANYNVAGRSDGGNFGGNYAGSDGGLPSYNSEGGANSNNTGAEDSYRSSTTSGGYPKEDAYPTDDDDTKDGDFEDDDDTKDGDFEPDDYADKRS